MHWIIVISLLLAFPAMAVDWDSSPQNWQNSELNWQNSPYNWENSPHNWNNSPQRFGNERIIRDNEGRAQGYAVPRQDGGTNFYDFDGNRKGYMPGRR